MGEKPRGNLYEINDKFKVLDPDDFFNLSENKANLLRYLCDRWSKEPMEGNMKLYLAGGFANIEHTVVVSRIGVQLVDNTGGGRSESNPSHFICTF